MLVVLEEGDMGPKRYPPEVDRGRAIVWSVRAAAILIFGFQLGDVFSTNAILAHAGAVEANPLAKFLLAWGWLGVAKIGLATLLCVRLAKRETIPTALLAATWAVAGFYAAVVVGNLLALRLVG